MEFKEIVLMTWNIAESAWLPCHLSVCSMFISCHVLLCHFLISLCTSSFPL